MTSTRTFVKNYVENTKNRTQQHRAPPEDNDRNESNCTFHRLRSSHYIYNHSQSEKQQQKKGQQQQRQQQKTTKKREKKTDNNTSGITRTVINVYGWLYGYGKM